MLAPPLHHPLQKRRVAFSHPHFLTVDDELVRGPAPERTVGPMLAVSSAPGFDPYGQVGHRDGLMHVRALVAQA